MQFVWHRIHTLKTNSITEITGDTPTNNVTTQKREDVNRIPYKSKFSNLHNVNTDVK